MTHRSYRDRSLLSAHGAIWLVLLIIVLYAGANMYVSGSRVLPLEQDEAHHLTRALAITQALHQGSWPDLRSAVRETFPWPPLFHVIMGAAAALAGASYNVWLMVQVVFLGILLGSVYSLTRRITGQGGALLAVLMTAACPIIQLVSQWMVTELLLAALTSATVALLLASREFSRRGVMILLGMVLAAGMLTKWVFIFFVMGPLLVVAYQASRHTVTSYQRWNVALMTLAGIIGAGPWYAAVWPRLIERVPGGLVRIGSDIPIFSLPGWLFYGQSLYFSFGWWLSAVALGAGAYACAKRRVPGVIFAWLAFSCVSLSLIPNKWAHYMIPAVPGIAVLSSIGIDALGTTRYGKAVARFFAGLVIAVAVWHLIVLPWGMSRVGDFTPYRLLQQLPLVRIFGQTFPGLRYFRFPCLVKTSEPMNAADRQEIAALTTAVAAAPRRHQPVLNIGLVEFNAPVIDASIRVVLQKGGIREFRLFSLVAQPQVFAAQCEDLDVLLIHTPHNEAPSPEAGERLMNAEHFDESEARRIVRQTMADCARILPQFRCVVKCRLYKDDVYVLTRDVTALTADAGASKTWQQSVDRFGPEEARQFLISAGNDSLMLQLAQGTWHLYYRNQPLTASLGIYSSVLSGGIWYDSTDFVWDVSETTPVSLTAVGYSRRVPIRQTWKFSWEKGPLQWRIWMDVGQRIQVEREQTNVMAGTGYTGWQSTASKGLFPASFTQEFDGDWQILASSLAKNGRFISLKALAALPQLRFGAAPVNPGTVLNVVQSDDFFRGRLLQAQWRSPRGMVLNPGRFFYFEGTVDIVPQDK